MSIVSKIVDTLYDGNSDAYYTFPEIINILKTQTVPIQIEQRRGTRMRWNNEMVAPFDYGEIPHYLNPVDDMGWDVIVAPSSQSTDPSLKLAGVVRISDKAEDVPYPNGNIKGNHKLIFASEGKTTDDDKKLITAYFMDNNVFMKPEFFDNVEEEIKRVIDEDWEASTMGRMKLGNFRNKNYGGIAVGPTARGIVGAKKFHNTMPRTGPGMK